MQFAALIAPCLLCSERTEQVANLLPKAARVHVIGTLVRDTWNDQYSGVERSAFELIADYVSLDLGCVRNVALRQKEA